MSHLQVITKILTVDTDIEESAKGEYQGMVHLNKASYAGCLHPTAMKLGNVGRNLGFQLGRRHGLQIEAFALPPEGGTSERRTQPNLQF